MNVKFTSVNGHQSGLIAALLRASYAGLTGVEPIWRQEQEKWDEYDRQVFAYPETIGACLFLTLVDGEIAGFGSWDPRQMPACAVIGHNCILPAFRGKGLGKQQIQEILRRFQILGVRIAKVSTIDHPFFIPARHMYVACGFREIKRVPWDRNHGRKIIEYEKELVLKTDRQSFYRRTAEK